MATLYGFAARCLFGVVFLHKASEIAQNQNLSKNFRQKTHRNTHDEGRDRRLTWPKRFCPFIVNQCAVF